MIEKRHGYAREKNLREITYGEIISKNYLLLNNNEKSLISTDQAVLETV